MSNRLTFSLASFFIVCMAFALVVTTADAAPTFSGTQADLTYTVGDVVSIQLPEATESTPGQTLDELTLVRKTATGDKADPILTSIGLAFAGGPAGTRTLSGTIVLPAGKKTGVTGTYVYTATNSTPDPDLTAKQEFTITVNSTVSFGGATVTNKVWKNGKAYEFRLPAATDSRGSSVTYALSPEIGDTLSGLAFNSTLRYISGTPNISSDALPTADTEFTYTATGGSGASSATAELKFKLKVVADSDPVFPPVTVGDISGAVGTAIKRAQLPTATDADGDEVTHVLTPDLPAGLTFDEDLFLIEGTPTASMDKTKYTWTATDADGGTAATKEFNITITATSTPPTGAPTKPTAAPTVPTAPTGLAIALSWTAHTDTTVTGYQVKVYKGDTAAAATAATTPVATIEPASITGTSHTYMTTEADRGKYFAFTVAGVNAQGTGAHSDKGTPVMVPMASVTNNKPAFDAGASIADIEIWKGQDYISAALPMATDDVGDTVTHTFDPALPTGFAYVEQVNTRYIKVTGTATAPASVAALKDEKFDYVATDSAGATAKISFKITLKKPIAPTVSPSDADTFMAGEQGLADWTNKVGWVDGQVLRNGNWVSGKVPAPRAENTNEIHLAWEAPSTDPEADYGAKIDKYMVYQEKTSVNPTEKTTYEVKADKTEFTTPPLTNGTYHFDVTAINSAGESKLKEPSHNPVVVCSPPGVATDLRAAVDQNADAVTLDWNIPGSNGGCAIEGYVVYQTDENNNSVLYFHENTTTNFRTPALSTGQYVFRVAAVNADDVGGKSTGTQFATIVSVDQPPVFEVTSIDDITIMGGDTLNPTITLPKATDPEGESVAYTVTPALPSGLLFTTSSRTISGTVANVTADSTTHHTYTASDGAKSATLTFSVTVTRLKPATINIPTANSSSAPISIGTGIVPAYGFYVLVRDVEGSGTYSPTTWGRSGDTSLPDLAWFFGGDPAGGADRTNGGTIALNGPGSKKDLVISEIMWGTDSSLAVPARSQWIEFYNATPGPISLAGYTITFHRSQVPSSAWSNARDVVSNAGRIYFGHSEMPGQSGRTNPVDTQGRYADTREIISMYRVINHVGVQHYNTANRGERDKRIGGWAESMYPTANIHAGRVATPGAEQIKRVTFTKTTFSQRVIINEIGNSSTDMYDWIELYNTTDGTINLKNWDFTKVYPSGSVAKEDLIFKFPDNDSVQIPAKSYLVVAASDPKTDGNDLAAGIDIQKSDANQVNTGLGSKVGIGHQANNKTAYYYVNTSLKIENSGHILYVLRNDGHKDRTRVGEPIHVEDAVGTFSKEVRGDLPSGYTGYAANSMQLWNTATWPFQEAGKRHDKTVDGNANALGTNKVYQREGKKLYTAEKHLVTRGYTGIGYDRHALNNGENGGTPGYSNGSLVGERDGGGGISALKGQVSISEIMLATHEKDDNSARVPRAIRLPQWIEIYNNSLTEGVNLHNWYLEIRNTDSEDLITRDLHGTLRLPPNVYIPPNQTVLIVSSSGMNSGNFPAQRVINLFTNSGYRTELSLQNRNDPILSQVGFYLSLRDSKNRRVDEIGNLPASDRRGIEPRGSDNFKPVWDLPEMNHPQGPRTSLIRIYDKGQPSDGLKPVATGALAKGTAVGWRRAVDTNFTTVPGFGFTYYGNQRDFGTPGYRGGGPLPVSLSKFRPERLKATGEVVIRWITESELNNAGFNILRSETKAGEYTKLNTQLIKGQGTTSERTTYEWKDTSAKPNVVYYYQIQDVSLDGQVTTLRVSRLKGNVNAVGKATTIWGELKALQ